uniref:Uncharacterized protein n=1 Tax=Manihot esculenta TaxID=3983 RepID=A0A2C9W646_MANES
MVLGDKVSTFRVLFLQRFLGLSLSLLIPCLVPFVILPLSKSCLFFFSKTRD